MTSWATVSLIERKPERVSRVTGCGLDKRNFISGWKMSLKPGPKYSDRLFMGVKWPERGSHRSPTVAEFADELNSLYAFLEVCVYTQDELPLYVGCSIYQPWSHSHALLPTRGPQGCKWRLLKHHDSLLKMLVMLCTRSAATDRFQLLVRTSVNKPSDQSYEVTKSDNLASF